ncbi:MAG: protein-glutamate O-methyltransferase CheR [Verrucomicrobia bacterium]|nr:protein-glutamate O-methyltransferase CheR [Verrucomicrobiota bacterium]
MLRDKTTPTLSNGQQAALDEFIAVMLQRHGFDISVFDESFFEKSLEKRLGALPCRSVADYLEGLSDNSTEAEAFYQSLRIGYSEFFRNPLAFALLEQTKLPRLLDEKKKTGHEIRIWSAGCATGQEAWSVAIVLDELICVLGKQADYRIFATDLLEADLVVARAGVYNAEALKNVRLRQLDGCFVQQGECYAIADRLRSHVDFTVYDLLDESTACPSASIYGDFDIVLCSNVLLYYRPEVQRLILDKLRRCLAPGGYVVVGESERQIVERTGGFRFVAPPATVFQIATIRR